MDNLLTERKRIYYLDIARFIAIILVSFNHAVSRSFINYGAFGEQYKEFLRLSGFESFFKGFMTVISHMGVPLFLMITGALLLNKKIEDEKDVKRFYKHNLLSLLITAQIWYFIMYWLVIFGNPEYLEITKNTSFLIIIKDLLKTMLFIEPITLGSMWYIPMILCVYLVIPFIALVRNKMSLKIFLPILLILLFSEMIFINYNEFNSLQYKYNFLSTVLEGKNLFSMYFLYIFAGYFIHEGCLKKIPLWVMLTFFVLGLSAMVGYQCFGYSRLPNFLVHYNFVGMLLVTAALFELLRRLGEKVKERKPVTYISKISFAIYFVHIVIMDPIYWNAKTWLATFTPIGQFFVLEIISFAGSILIIWLLSKIKVCKKYLFRIKD